LTETVFGTGLERHGDRFCAVAVEETAAMLAEVDANGGELRWEHWERAYRRLARRVLFGAAAREDEELSGLLGELMSAANGLPSEAPERLEEFEKRIAEYVESAPTGSLAAVVAETPADPETEAAGQLTHWFFATQDTLAINSLRALALIASHPRQRERVEKELVQAGVELDAEGVGRLEYLGGCVQEAMRIWPTTPLLSRETVDETVWGGAAVPAGTQVLISNLLNHRDPATHAFADRFAPEVWTEGSAPNDWSFNHLSHGPQGCPGATLALLLGRAVLAGLLRQRRVRLLAPRIDPERPLPHAVDFFALRFSLEPMG
jgi:cytochrome P450